MKYNISILGGTDGFGKWLAATLIELFDDKIILTITGRDVEKGHCVASTIGARFMSDNTAAVQNANITIFAVPIEYMQSVIEQVGPHIPEKSIVLDVTSVKQFPKHAMQSYCHPSVLIIPTHPMFSQFVSSLMDQVVILTPDEAVRQDHRYKFLYDTLIQKGAHVIETTAEEHDTMMSVVQGLTHYNMFTLGRCLEKLDIDISKSLQFMSPIYKILNASIGRYLDQNPMLYANIQMYNPENIKVHNSFIESCEEFHSAVVHKDTDTFYRLVEGAKKHFGSQTHEGQIYTDKLTYMVSEQYRIARQSLGQQVELNHIYDHTKLSAKLIAFEDDLMMLEGCDKSYHIHQWYITPLQK